MLRFPYLTRRGNKAGYKGVRASRDKFIAQVHRGGERFHLGTFATEQQAAMAVNEALTMLYPSLPSRFLNRLPPDDHPSLEEQEAIRREVALRLGSEAFS